MDRTPLTEYLELADWRRRVAATWDAWRRECVVDPAAASAAYRAGKDVLFREHPQSPLLPERRATFTGLPYWPYDSAWRMVVRLEPFDTATVGPHDESAAPLGGCGRSRAPRRAGPAQLRVGQPDVPAHRPGEPLGAAGRAAAGRLLA